MTIASFCRDQLLAHGPLTLDELGTRASRAGVTASSDPRNAVRSAMKHREVELHGERMVTPLWLLEGRCLTTRNLDLSGEGDDRRSYDLGLLDLALSLGPIPFVDGGTLRRTGYDGAWKCTGRLPEPGDDELLCFRVVGRALEVTTVPAAAVTCPDPLRTALDVPEPRYRDYRWSTAGVVHRRLSEAVLADDALLREPAPPLSSCCPMLAAEAERELVERRAGWYRQPWYDEPCDHGPALNLRLTDEEEWTLQRLASAAGLGLETWLQCALEACRARAPRERWLRALP
jgi:hypothetical protein